MTQRSIIDNERLRAFIALFLKWNSKINLSAARSEDEVAEHVIDSLALLPHLEGARSLLDVGAGGGFPGAIIALVRPDLRVVSLEPIHKKHAFLAAVRRELAATNYEPRAIRVEQLPDAERFDVAVSRATFALLDWLQIGAELVVPGGVVLGMEGQVEAELPPGASRVSYDSGDRTRAIVVYRPTQPAP